MKSPSNHRTGQTRIAKQRGVVLFFALIAVVLMSLAAVALIRSVDTGTLIAGNLAFKQAVTSSADIAIDDAMNQLAALQNANVLIDVIKDPAHPFNQTNAAIGYYSNANDTFGTVGYVNVFADATWDAIDQGIIPERVDGSGNRIRYVIQRMCRNANQAIETAECLFSGALQDINGKQIPLPQQICEGAGCPSAGQTPQIRITARSVGPRNTVSYVQAFVY